VRLAGFGAPGAGRHSSNPISLRFCFGLNDGALGSHALWDWKAKLTQQKSSGSIQQQRVDSIHQEKKAQLVPSVPLAEFEKHLRTLSIANKNSGQGLPADI